MDKTDLTTPIPKLRAGREFVEKTVYKRCTYCNIDVLSKKWAPHTYLLKHKKNMRKKITNPLIINSDEVNLKQIKRELEDMKEHLNIIITNIEKIKT